MARTMAPLKCFVCLVACSADPVIMCAWLTAYVGGRYTGETTTVPFCSAQRHKVPFATLKISHLQDRSTAPVQPKDTICQNSQFLMVKGLLSLSLSHTHTHTRTEACTYTHATSPSSLSCTTDEKKGHQKTKSNQTNQPNQTKQNKKERNTNKLKIQKNKQAICILAFFFWVGYFVYVCQAELWMLSLQFCFFQGKKSGSIM